MSIEYNGDTAVFKETAAVDEAETFLEWTTEHKDATVDLSECVHVHTAVLQVMMAAKPKIGKFPEEREFNTWIHNVLKFKKEI